MFVREYSSNLSVSLPFFGIRILSDNSSTPSDNNNSNNDPYGFFNAHLNPSITINIILFKFLTIFVEKRTSYGNVGILGIAWSFGGMIFVLVYCTAGILG